MKPEEIKKALEGMVKFADTVDRSVLDAVDVQLLKDTLDLINRLQAKVIKEQNKNSKLRNERNRLQSQNKDLAETIHNLTLEKDALFDKAEELKVEVERLKTNLNVELENFATEYDNKIKAEAIKEFAEKVFKEIQDAIISNDKAKNERIEKHNVDRYEDDFCIMCDGKIMALGGIRYFIKNLLKEMGVE